MVNWNDAYPLDAPDQGPALHCRDGDLIAYGEQEWTIIGRVDVDTVAQNLQSVTDLGNTTTNSIIVGREEPIQPDELDGSATMEDGILYAAGGRRADKAMMAGQEPWHPAEGDIHGKRLSVDDIDFDGFPLLEQTP